MKNRNSHFEKNQGNIISKTDSALEPSTQLEPIKRFITFIISDRELLSHIILCQIYPQTDFQSWKSNEGSKL